MGNSNCWKRIVLVQISIFILGIWMYNIIKNGYIKYGIYHMEKLTITLNYDENQGLPVTELSDYLLSINNAYYEFSKKNATLYIKSISKGSIIIKLKKQVILPLLYGLFTNSLYDFGKHLISATKYVLNDKEVVEKVNKGDRESINKVNQSLMLVGKNITVNNIFREASSSEKVNSDPVSIKIDKEDRDKVHNIVKIINNNKNLINETPQKVEPYESVIIQFDSISNKSNYFKGIISSINHQYKKVIFESENIKDSFNFNQFDFHQKYLVSVKVYYNNNGSIAKYCITENLGKEK